MDENKSSSNVKAAIARGSFATTMGALVATLGSAIGLGNIWKFPSMTGTNGGAAFIIIYIISTLVVGLPVMIAEIMMGRKARANAIGTMQKLNPNKNQPWWIIGAMGALAAFLIMAYYSEVAGWVLAYVFKAISGSILSTDPAVTSAAFADMIANPFLSLAIQWVVLAFVCYIIVRGVSKGIEATTKRLIPLLFVLVLIVDIRSLTLPGAGEGIKFLFNPDFSKITAAAVLAALGLAFFKLSIGMGTMITYGSYWQDDQNIPTGTARIMLSDLLVSILAGLAVFPAVFAFGFEPDAGASLLFITIPAVFASMPLGNIFMVLFFLLAIVAATGAMISLVEVPVAFLNEKLNWSRAKAAIVTTVAIALVGMPAALSNSLMANFKLFGKTMFDLFDFLTSNIMLPLGGLLIVIFIGWIWGKKKVEEALSNGGTLKNQAVINFFFTVAKFVTPVLVLIVMLSGLGIIKF
jgi:NSS family neurotransmitter:Na+ symporter